MITAPCGCIFTVDPNCICLYVDENTSEVVYVFRKDVLAHFGVTHETFAARMIDQYALACKKHPSAQELADAP